MISILLYVSFSPKIVKKRGLYIDRGFLPFQLSFQSQTSYISTGSSFYTDHNGVSLSFVLTTRAV